MQILYEENSKILIGDIKEDLDKWKNVLFFWKGGMNIVNIFIFFK